MRDVWEQGSRRTAWALAAALAVVGLGCESCGSSAPRPAEPEPRAAAPEPSPRTTTEQATEAAEPEPAAPEEPEPAQVAPAPEPAPALAVETARTPSGATVTLSNRTTEPVRFASLLVLERVVDGRGEALPARGRMLARLAADRPLPDCAELLPGALLELSFDGLRGEACTECDAPAAGDYRFVVTSCGGTGRAEGPTFAVEP